MATAPSISVVIPVFNAAAHLPACLDSVLADTRPDLELVAVDDGSTDDSAAILAERAAHDPRVRIVRHQDGRNRGVAATRNLGLASARGEYVWFVDADDRVHCGAIDMLLDIAQGEHADVVAFNGEATSEGAPAARIHRAPKPEGAIAGEAWVALCCRQKEFRHYVWLRLYRRAYLASIGLAFREGIVHEDIAWITEGDLCAQRLVYVDRVLYDYVQTPASLTRAETDAKLLHRAESMLVVIAQLRDINARCAMAKATRGLLRAEIVGQAMQIDRLRRRLADPALRRGLDERLRRERFWGSLWPEAATFTRKRQLARILWREAWTA
jgi:glycosyltransferase involved in cell wall biosynthesis